MSDVTTDLPALLERLGAHKTLSPAPRSELEWLVAHATWRRYAAGEIAASRTEEATELIVVLSGRIAVYFEHGTGRRHVMESRAGGVTGVLPFSRMGRPLGDAVVEEPSEVLALHRDHIPELIRQCPVITSTLVHLMLDRARRFAATNWQDEKMVSLGRLAAGIAHELNNPASAAVRSAALLDDSLRQVGRAAQAYGAAPFDEAQRARVSDMIDRALAGGALGPLERADREDEIARWLEAHAVDPASAATLADCGVEIDALDSLATAIPAPLLDRALGWIVAARAAHLLATDVSRAASRIYDLVSVVKRFTNLDRATAVEPTNIADGLRNTVALFAARIREKSAVVTLDVAPDLPAVAANPGDLNQVWSNLLDNALDAIGEAGEVTIRASLEGDAVVVRCIDNGAGMSPEVQTRMFDPFFTTKRPGEGAGVGLDIARRIVRMHDGQIEVDAQPGRTEFRVRIPCPPSAPDASSAREPVN